MRSLAIFAKHPTPGQVKSRLAAQSSPEWAARVADAFLRDLTAKFANLDAKRVLVYAPSDASGYFAEVSASRYALVPQRSGDLGMRLEGFITEHLASTPGRLVIIGSDSPTLPLDLVAQAFDLLESSDVVLGPATDGGYYLIGCRRPPPIFKNIDWSGPQVLAQTVACLTPKWRLALLPPWYDVDTLADWQTLQGHISALRRADIDPQTPCTESLKQAQGPFT